MTSVKRTPISKKIRFEVFKRDSFKCQYCGAEAPHVVLHVDHIKPVAAGGTNEMFNLITSCQPCNLGKKDIELSEHSVLAKSRGQLEELSARREQLELMLSWRESLLDLSEQTVNRVAAYLSKLLGGVVLDESQKLNLKKFISKNSIDEAITSLELAAEFFSRAQGYDCADAATISAIIDKAVRICNVRKASQREPELQQLLYIRAIVRNRVLGYFDNKQALSILKDAHSKQVSIESLTNIAKSTCSWKSFCSEISEAVEASLKWLEDSDLCSAEEQLAFADSCLEEKYIYSRDIYSDGDIFDGLRAYALLTTDFIEPKSFEPTELEAEVNRLMAGVINGDGGVSLYSPCPSSGLTKELGYEVALQALWLRNFKWDFEAPAWKQILYTNPELFRCADVYLSHVFDVADKRKCFISKQYCVSLLDSYLRNLKCPAFDSDEFAKSILGLKNDVYNLMTESKYHKPSKAFILEVPIVGRSLFDKLTK